MLSPKFNVFELMPPWHQVKRVVYHIDVFSRFMDLSAMEKAWQKKGWLEGADRDPDIPDQRGPAGLP